MNVIHSVTTERLILRKFDPEKDLDQYASILGQRDVGKWLPKREAYTYAESERIMKAFVDHWQRNGFGAWALTTKDGNLLGHMGLNLIPDLNEVEVLYALGKEGWGHGYATEGANISAEIAFEQLGCEKIIGLTSPENLASQHVLEKLGMKYKKTFQWQGRELYYYELFKKDYVKGKSGI